ncbi:MAG: DNA-3-methyladenine glycosylase [Christensenellales bacterium]
MIDVVIPGFDIALTADSGQCFRFLKLSPDNFRLIALGRRLDIGVLGEDRFAFSCTRGEFDTLWSPYFDLQEDYLRFRSLIPRDDAFLGAALRYAGGLRILRQAPFETLISFIISQRKTIQAIKGCVEALSRRFGDRIDEESFSFPGPEGLAKADLASLLACGLGYRSRYILATSRSVWEGRIDLEALSLLQDDALHLALCGLDGVGDKVAQCVMLFAYHRLAAFPRDVWVNRVIDREYGGSFPEHLYKGHAGVIQQYMFCYGRSAQWREMQKT